MRKIFLNILNKTFIFIFNFLKKIKQKSLIAIVVVKYIYIYISNLLDNWLNKKFEDKSFSQEMKSLGAAVLFAFFFYYFIVIELSILIFGYSLICYWFLFLFLFISLIISWRLEVFFIKYILTNKEKWFIEDEKWLFYYDGSSPYSLYDYITNYKKKPLFRFTVIESNIGDIEYGRYLKFLFFSLFSITFFYFCSYWFTPRFITFVAHYFYPIINFFESWGEPWLVDFYSAIIWFWNWLVYYLDYKYQDQPFKLSLVEKIPSAPEWWEDWADLVWLNKISLWKTSDFGDIFFLWTLRTHYPVYKLVFGFDQPTVLIEWFEPNIPFFFMRYLWGQFDLTKKNFWKNNFIEDPWFWKLVTRYWDDYDRVQLQEEEFWESTTYFDDNMLVPSYTDFLLSKNYFNNISPISQKSFLDYGAYWDIYSNLTTPREKSYIDDFPVFEQTFVWDPEVPYPQSYFWLWRFHKWTKNKLEKYIKKDLKKLDWQIVWSIYENYGFKFQNLINFLNPKDIELSLENYYIFPLYEDIYPMELDDIRNATEKELSEFLRRLDWRLAVLEEKFSLTPWLFSHKDYKWITWWHLVTMVVWRIWRLDARVNNRNIFYFFKNQIPSWYEFIDAINNSYQPSRWMKKIYEKIKNSWIKIYVLPKEDVTRDIIMLEKIMWDFEKWVNLRYTYPLHYYYENEYLFWKPTFFPWYVWSIKYFNSIEKKIALPAFQWFIVPTPYPTPFSTFGLNWFKYQIYRLENTSLFVSESIAYVGDWSSSPTILYTGVEAIMYIRPILNIFNFISNIFIKLISYPIEFIATKIPWISERLSVIVFLVHLTWFLHFYIYAFLFFYCFYYFAKYYYYKSSYMWIYEWMFETAFVNQNNGLVYWHTLNDIWSNYKHPLQFSILSLQTTLLLSYSFSKMLNFLTVTKYGNFKFLTLLSVFFSESKNILKYFLINGDKTVFYKNLLKTFYYKFFKFYFNLNIKKYNILLYDGGNDCNVDFMVWDYFDYLSQTSIYISWSLIKNKYFKKKDFWLLTLIKHATILFTSNSILPNFYFLSMPLLDTLMARKLISELLTFFEFNNYNSEDFYIKYLYNLEEFKNMLSNSLFLNLWFNFFNFFTKTGTDLYKIFDLKELNFISKNNKKNFWESDKYWIFAFFWSFRFISKFRYPHLNLPWNHEFNRLQLRRMAYTNSWIGSTINIRPFFNIIQHIWWTSWVYNWAFSITDNYLNLNIAGLRIKDNVWNFLEKRYSSVNQNKTETLFGVVRTLSVIVGKKNYKWGIWFSRSLFNFDLSYPTSTINWVTTNWVYPKTNPPINLIKLNITPFWLFYFFKYISSTYPFLYLTFFEQLEFIDKSLYKNLKWELKKEYETIPFFNILAKIDCPILTSKFDFYLKKFDILLATNKRNELSNWVFSFDTSFFFNHFLTWDFLIENQTEIKFNWLDDEIKKNKLYFFIKNHSFSEINAKYTMKNHWFQKPFGVLDKFELINMQKYKSSKNLDVLSFTSNKENNFTYLEKETLKKNSGFSFLDFNDGWTSADSYNENFVGEWMNWFSFNNSLVANTISPIILGWVGDLYMSTTDCTSILFSSLYSTEESHPLAFKEDQLYYFKDTNIKYRWKFLKSYFSCYKNKKRLYSRLFSWLNLSLFPTSFRNFFGIKTISRLDYWSWKCGIQIDYWNGFYNYRPYLGYWHSFGSKLMVFDSLYGFYWSYRQIEDDPTLLDLETDAMEKLYEEREETVDDDDEPHLTYKDFYDVNEIEDWYILWDLSLLYWEVYFSFHHPYFLGYFLFWFLILLTKQQYLGLVNFSFKWLILKNFYLINNSINKIDFNLILNERNIYENKFWKNMFWYWLYFVNASKLTTNFTNMFDKETSLQLSKEDHIIAVYRDLYDVLKFLKTSMNLSLTKLNFLLDCKRIDLQLLKINWFNMDTPFPLNPYIVVNRLMFNSFNIDYEKIYNSYFLSFSHYDSLRENINLNMLFDDYLGTYLDSFNFISYYSTYRSLSSLPEHFLDKPNYLATQNLWFWFDFSRKMASDLFDNIETYDNQDMLTSFGLLLQNLSFLKFFTSSVDFILLLSANINDYWFFWIFLELYITKTDFGLEFAWLWWWDISPEDWKYSPIINPINSYISQQKHIFFLYQFCWTMPYDLLLIWLELGIFFFKKKSFQNFFQFWKISITNRFLFLKWFYTWIGYQLYVFFFWK